MYNFRDRVHTRRVHYTFCLMFIFRKKNCVHRTHCILTCRPTGQLKHIALQFADFSKAFDSVFQKAAYDLTVEIFRYLDSLLRHRINYSYRDYGIVLFVFTFFWLHTSCIQVVLSLFDGVA